MNYVDSHLRQGAVPRSDGDVLLRPKNGTTMDRFAEVYVPRWLKQVNEDRPVEKICRSVAERASINYLSHIMDIYPPSLLHRLLGRETMERARIQELLLKMPDPQSIFISTASTAPHITGQNQRVSSSVLIRRKADLIMDTAPFSRSSNDTLDASKQKRKAITLAFPSKASAVPSHAWQSVPAKSADSIMREAVLGSFCEDGKVPKPSLSSQNCDPLDNPPPLDEETYALHWIPLLIVERNARIKQLTSATLYQVSLVRQTSSASGNASAPWNLYTLEALSIREGWPPVDIGDVLLMRQLRPTLQSWQGIEFEASVWGVSRSAGQLIIRCDALREREDSLLFNILWMVQDHVFFGWRRAIEMLQLLSNPKDESNVIRTWLLPTFKDQVASAVTEIPPEYTWVDENLNAEQKLAVKSMLWGKHKMPFLISGPPGSGKTKTVVEAIMQILSERPTSHILVCGASDPSADTLAKRLHRQGLSPQQLFRMNFPGRPFSEVRDELLLFCHVEGEKFKLPEMSTLLSKRVIVSTCLNASMLLEARCTNHDLAAVEDLVSTSIHPNKAGLPLEPHFSYLIVDEAGQASEPELCCALAVVATESDRCTRAHITLCGDIKQLGPQVVSKQSGPGLDVSLLERLSERDVYRNHPVARRNRKKVGDVEWKLGTPFVDLTKNYRSCVPILMLPSTLFYNETLEACAAVTTQNSPLHSWKGLVSPGFPIVFRGIEGQDEPVDEGASYWNEAEVDYVRSQVLDLVKGDENSHGRLKPSEISVISPFREQVWRIRLALRAERLGEVDVGNVEALQGAENRVVIISTVRSNLRWLPRDLELGRGIIHEPKRFNVAMTRAKELLIVVGNAQTLTVDPYWLSYYRFCRRNNCYKGKLIENDDESTGAEAMSRLEQQYNTNLGHPERAFDVLVGSLTRQTLEDEGSDESR